MNGKKKKKSRTFSLVSRVSSEKRRKKKKTLMIVEISSLFIPALAISPGYSRISKIRDH